MSSWVIAIVAAKNAVIPPKIITKINATCANSNKGEQRIIKKTPAVTKVAAWIKAETGVGPSIASGSQVCNPNWADFPAEPRKKNTQIIFKQKKSIPRKEKITFSKKGAIQKTVEKSIDLKK